MQRQDGIAAVPGSPFTLSEPTAMVYGRVGATLPAWNRRQRGSDADATATRVEPAPPLSTALAVILATVSSGEISVTAPAVALLAVWAAAMLAASVRGERTFEVFSWRSVLLPSSLERPG